MRIGRKLLVDRTPWSRKMTAEQGPGSGYVLDPPNRLRNISARSAIAESAVS
jgi:hypothetical protein